MSVYELWRYIQAGETEPAVDLLKKKAEIKAKINEYIGFLTCLHLACIEGNFEVCKTLLDHAAQPDLKAKVNGWTALHYTAKKGHLPCMKLLLATSAKLVKVKNNKGQTAVFTAVCNDNLDCLKALMQHNSKLNTSDNIGKAPIHYAAQFGHIQCLKKLIGEGADITRKVSLDTSDSVLYSNDCDLGKTAYDLAVDNKQHTVAKLLKELHLENGEVVGTGNKNISGSRVVKRKNNPIVNENDGINNTRL